LKPRRASKETGRKLLGQMLVEEGLLSPTQLLAALDQQMYYRERLGETLVRLGYITERQLLEFLGKQNRTPVIDLYNCVIDENAVSLVPKQVAERYKVLPIGFKKIDGVQRLVLAMADPKDQEAIDYVSHLTTFLVYPVFVREEHLRWIISYYYDGKLGTRGGLDLDVEEWGPVRHRGVPERRAPEPIEVIDEDDDDDDEVIDLGPPIKKGGKVYTP